MSVGAIVVATDGAGINANMAVLDQDLEGFVGVGRVISGDIGGAVSPKGANTGGGVNVDGIVVYEYDRSLSTVGDIVFMPLVDVSYHKSLWANSRTV